MYIRIEFENIGSDETTDTQEILFGSPNGMFLSSSNAFRVSSKKIRDIVGDSVAFWYLDVDILNKHYYGVMNCLNELVKYPGVSRVDVLPIEGHYIGNIDEVCDTVMKYITGVV